MPQEQSPDVNAAASSTATTDVKSPDASSTPGTATPPALGSMEDALKVAFQKSNSQPTGETQVDHPIDPVPAEENKKEEETTTEPEKEDERTPEEIDAEEEKTKAQDDSKKPIPYDRFQEVNNAKVQLEAQIAEIKPRAEEYDSIVSFCQGNNISPDEYKYWMTVAAMAQSNPVKAVELLNPRFTQLQAHTGTAWSADTKKAVDDGLITPEYANRITAAEANAKFQEEQSKRTQQQQFEQLRHQNLIQLQTSLGAWESQKKQGDPDFAPKTDPKGPDGKYEIFCQIFESQVKNAKSIQDILSTADQVYAKVSQTFQKFSPRPNPTKNVRSSQSTSTPPPPPKSLEEAIRQRLAANGALATR